ncbi:MAG: hypothetical protein ACE5K0_12605, partial [Candidatus Methanofastidiosia archaeon]
MKIMSKKMFVMAVVFVILVGFSVKQVKAQTITITQPNGGEYLLQGGTYEIKWNTSGAGVGNKVKLYYSINSGASYPNFIACVDNTGSYNWTVPNIDYSTVRVKALWVSTCSFLAILNDSDESDSDFDIGPFIFPTITLFPTFTIAPTLTLPPTITLFPTFTIPPGIFTWIVVSQPNGGETLTAGGTYNITWSTSATGGYVDLFYKVGASAS